MGYNVLDTETTGLDPIKDQIIEYYAAYATRTTALSGSDLYISDRQGPLRCRLMPNILPSPKALRVNNLRLADINKAPISHYQMMRQIYDRMENYSRDERLFNTAYNMPFDERRIRIDAFRNLISPNFLRDGSLSRTSFDTLKMVRAATALYPEQFIIPELDGKPTFRQGPFARAQGLHFPEEFEHSAQHDVESGTFAIASHIRTIAPNVWDLTVQTADTSQLLQKMRKDRNSIYVHVNTMGNTRDITLCSIIDFRRLNMEAARASPHVLVWDLSHDPALFENATKKQRMEWMKGAEKKSYRDKHKPPHGIWPLKIINLRDDHFMVPLKRVEHAPGMFQTLFESPMRDKWHTAVQKFSSEFTWPLLDKLSKMFTWVEPPEGSPIEKYLFTRDDGIMLTTELSETVKKSNRTHLKKLIADFHSCGDDWEKRGTVILPEVRKLSALVWERMLMLVGEHGFQHLDYEDASHFIKKLKHDLESPESQYRTYKEVIEETEGLIKTGTKEDKIFYTDMLEELKRMREAHQRFFNSWEDEHQPDLPQVEMYEGTIVPEAGRTMMVRFG